MNEDLSRLRDPSTGDVLTQEDDVLVAPAGRRFPIVDNIPRFVDSEMYAADFGAQWRRFPKTQLDSYTGLSISEERLARCFGPELRNIHGCQVLEAGCGAGRFSEVLLNHGALLDSFDISSAVEANAANNGARPFTLAQADIRSIPFEMGAYDYVMCLGVLQHTPNTEESIGKLWDMVAPGGWLIIDHYRWSRWQLPPPIGGSDKLYRKVILRLPPEKRWPAVKRLVDFWFPIYWRWRDHPIMLRLLDRIGGINFYYNQLPLDSYEAFHEWSLLDTHDVMTDFYKRFRDVPSIRRTLEGLGAVQIEVWEGGIGVEARCKKRIY